MDFYDVFFGIKQTGKKAGNFITHQGRVIFVGGPGAGGGGTGAGESAAIKKDVDNIVNLIDSGGPFVQEQAATMNEQQWNEFLGVVLDEAGEEAGYSKADIPRMAQVDVSINQPLTISERSETRQLVHGLAPMFFSEMRGWQPSDYMDMLTQYVADAGEDSGFSPDKIPAIASFAYEVFRK